MKFENRGHMYDTEKIKITSFKKRLMRALIGDDRCLDKLIEMRSKIEYEVFQHEQEIEKKKMEAIEITEIIVYLRTPMEESK